MVNHFLFVLLHKKETYPQRSTMEYEYNRSRSGPQVPMYRAPPSIYPKIGPHPHSAAPRPPPFQHQNPNPSPSSNSLFLSCFHFPFPLLGFVFFSITCFLNFAVGLGIKVAIKPEYKIAPPVRFNPFDSF